MAPALLGLNGTLALASSLGPTSPILQEACAQRDAPLSHIHSAATKVKQPGSLVCHGFAVSEADALYGEAAVLQQVW